MVPIDGVLSVPVALPQTHRPGRPICQAGCRRLSLEQKRSRAVLVHGAVQRGWKDAGRVAESRVADENNSPATAVQCAHAARQVAVQFARPVTVGFDCSAKTSRQVQRRRQRQEPAAADERAGLSGRKRQRGQSRRRVLPVVDAGGDRPRQTVGAVVEHAELRDADGRRDVKIHAQRARERLVAG
jgi:hypothetical protein